MMVGQELPLQTSATRGSTHQEHEQITEGAGHVEGVAILQDSAVPQARGSRKN